MPQLLRTGQFAPPPPSSAELAYWVGEPFWGRGIASQALAQFKRYAFSNFPLLLRLEADIFPFNKVRCHQTAR